MRTASSLVVLLLLALPAVHATTLERVRNGGFEEQDPVTHDPLYWSEAWPYPGETNGCASTGSDHSVEGSHSLYVRILPGPGGVCYVSSDRFSATGGIPYRYGSLAMATDGAYIGYVLRCFDALGNPTSTHTPVAGALAHLVWTPQYQISTPAAGTSSCRLDVYVWDRSAYTSPEGIHAWFDAATVQPA